MKLNRKVFSIITFAFLSLFVAYQSLTAYYTHPHQIRGGMIVHTHPFQKSDNEHTHTLFEFQLIDFTAVHLILVFFGTLLLKTLSPGIKYRLPFVDFSFSKGTRYIFHLRGPPVISVSHP